ncbi:MAG TPA: hypothetical protein VFX98_18415, partial [Longimicrobiaceae bacterium]|nr:hypothetical protein [Longimicrobiaceae bacterium]
PAHVPNAAAHPGHAAQHAGGGHAVMGHRMFETGLGGGWRLVAMGQVYPLITWAAPFHRDSPLHEAEAYLTQGVVMANLESPGSRWVVRTTLDLEGVTQAEGELTAGGWGEGFIDRRHPHTLVHEAMLSLNFWEVAGGALSLSAGKGFAPYGTDDPMSRPAAKYPTNHHLSQVLERWTVNAVYLRGPWSVEAGVFAGAEPEGPFDHAGNLRGFGDSWSARVARRFDGTGTGAEWELSASYASVAEEHHGEKARMGLWNAAVRHSGIHAFGGMYALAEASVSRPAEGDGLYSVLGEMRLDVGRHQPYARVEYATRPEYAREGPAGGEGFFRYDHDAEPVGATRWLIQTAGYGQRVRGYPVDVWPFVEAAHHRVWEERGGVDPEALFGTDSFWSLSLGVRLYFGGGPMRMGSYGALDDMTTMFRER